MRLVVLWSDVCIWLMLVVCLIGFIRPGFLLQQVVKHVSQSHLGPIVTVVLCSYLSVACLDSIHYQCLNHHDTRVVSVLDTLLSPLDQPLEKTYSAPFARTSWSKEMILQTNGTYQQRHPSLNYTQNTMAFPGDYVLKYGFMYLCVFLLLVVVAMALLGIRYSKEQIFTELKSMRQFFIALFGWLFVLFMLYMLSRHYHILGTDKVGHDVFFQAVKGIRTGILIGGLTLCIMLPLALLLGTIAGFWGGWLDDVIQYLYTTISSIPGVLLISASILAVQVYVDNHPDWFPTLDERGDLRLVMLCVVLGLTGWTGLCRLIRAETLKVKSYDFITAAQVMGVSRLMVVVRHIIPNVRHLVVISLALDFSALVLAEAVLSYVGVGVAPTTYSWGNMIHAARMELAREPMIWWRIIAAFTMMFTLILAANLLADKVRDALDPRLSIH